MSGKNGDEENVEEEDDADTDKGGSTEEDSLSSDGKFGQDEVNKLTGKARKEGRTVGQTTLLSDLGFEDLDMAQKYLKEKRDADDEEKSELDRTLTKFDVEKKRADDAESALKEQKVSALTQKLKSAVMLEIASNTKLNVHPKALNDIWSALAEEHLGDDGIYIDENGKIKGVVTSVEKLLKAKPYFASTPDEEIPSNNTRQKRKTVGTGEPIEEDNNPKYGKLQRNPRI